MKNSKIITLVLIGLLSAIAVSGQKKTAVELPMKFWGSVPAVEVMVNGQGPFLFIIDTGGQGSARITQALVLKLGLKQSGEVQASDPTGKNARTLKTYGIDSIDVGGIKFENLTAAARSFPMPPPGSPRIDGMLAFNLFKDHLLTLDYPGKKVRIETGDLPKANGKNILDYDSGTDDLVRVDIQIGSQKIKAQIDSGNMFSAFSLPASVVEKSGLSSEAVVVGKSATISSTIEIKEARLKDTIRLGSFEFPQPMIIFPSLSETTAEIGSKFLSEFAITLDQKNRRLKLERNKP